MRQGDSHFEPHGEQGHVHEHKEAFAEYVRLALMAAVIVAGLFGWWKHFMSRDWVAFVATLVGGYPIFQEAWENLRKRRMTMELSMTIALVAALCIGQFFTALLARAFSSMRRPYAVST
jgi:P-type Cu+ transporter